MNSALSHAPIATIAPAANREIHPKFNPEMAFQLALNARVERYFRLTRRSPRDCPAMYGKTAIVLTWFAASYLLLVFWASTWWLAGAAALSLGLAMAAVGFAVQHDGNHKAYSRHPWVNRLMGFTLDLLGGSSYVWVQKHNTVHHTYANIDGQDDDIDLGPLARLSPHQRWHWWHRAQHLYMWVLYSVVVIRWHFYNDVRDLARGRIGSHRFARPTGWSLVGLLGGKALWLTLAFVLPALLHPLWAVLLFYLGVTAVTGMCLGIVFEMAHVVEDAQFTVPDAATGRMDRPWAVHQLEATVDFARDNPVLTWLLGGLNYQIEHHLFPRVCHLHYPRIARLVEHACVKFGLQYHVHRTFRAGVAAHYRWLRTMSHRPARLPALT